MVTVASVLRLSLGECGTVRGERAVLRPPTLPMYSTVCVFHWRYFFSKWKSPHTHLDGAGDFVWGEVVIPLPTDGAVLFEREGYNHVVFAVKLFIVSSPLPTDPAPERTD